MSSSSHGWQSNLLASTSIFFLKLYIAVQFQKSIYGSRMRLSESFKWLLITKRDTSVFLHIKVIALNETESATQCSSRYFGWIGTRLIESLHHGMGVFQPKNIFTTVKAKGSKLKLLILNLISPMSNQMKYASFLKITFRFYLWYFSARPTEQGNSPSRILLMYNAPRLIKNSAHLKRHAKKSGRFILGVLEGFHQMALLLPNWHRMRVTCPSSCSN